MKNKSYTKIFSFILGAAISLTITFFAMHFSYVRETNSMYEDMRLMYKCGYYSGAVAFKESDNKTEFNKYFKKDSAILFGKYKY